MRPINVPRPFFALRWLPALVLELILVVVAVALAAAAETIDLGDEENQDHGIARLEISNHA